MPDVYACFYPGSRPFGGLVRLWTRSAYGHCSIRIGDTVYEALGWRSRFPWWRGAVTKRPAGPYEATCLQLPCPWIDPDDARTRAESKLGDGYDWPALGLTGLQKWFRGGFRLLDLRTAAYDCSRYQLYALGLDSGNTPSPQDAYLTVTERTKQWLH